MFTMSGISRFKQEHCWWLVNVKVHLHWTKANTKANFFLRYLSKLNVNINWTGMHSSRMRTVRPLVTVWRGRGVSPGGLCLGGFCPGGSLSRGVSVRGSLGVCPGWSLCGGGLWGVFLTDTPVNRITDRCKNISLLAVIIFESIWKRCRFRININEPQAALSGPLKVTKSLLGTKSRQECRYKCNKLNF